MKMLQICQKKKKERKIIESAAKKINCRSTKSQNNVATTFVFDGRSLLHKLIWNKGSMFGEICQGYLEFIGRNSQEDSCVVFDGYPVSPTAHIRRIKGICGQAVIFSLDTLC